ncbi:MAG: thiamine pyrophosphate-dependent dehydrogenase E1 component subunit alpha [Candidatus Aminicenantes bacterium]|nr:thiamine pyrophosphate-dependent dehydrogenase E1 component subunit alpha [Candidatus Aminicenantes bacterium]
MSHFDILHLYKLMLHSRLFENAVAGLWNEGLIFGEMHMGIGEEAIFAGIVSQLQPGDAMALDHRSTSPCIMRGLDPAALMLEFLGHPQGLCSGFGGHMHVFAKEQKIVTSGIVGASGPAAVGFALASRHKKQNAISVAFFGEGAVNQGMMLEAFNLASAWNLPVLFVCKDNGWAITTRSHSVTGGASLIDRANGFGIAGRSIEGWDVETVWKTANSAIESMRKDMKPFFFHALCRRDEGHFLGDPLLRFHRTPWKSFGRQIPGLTRSLFGFKGARLDKRISCLKEVLSLIAESRAQLKDEFDPLVRIETGLKTEEYPLERIQKSIKEEIDVILSDVMSTLHREDGE